MNRNILIGSIGLIFSSILTILLIPQFEFPDGTHHLVKVILVEEQRLNFESILSSMRNLYFIIIQPFHEISLFFDINDICRNMRVEKLMHCNEGTIYNHDFKYNKNNFSIFGLDINIYKYFNLSLSQNQIALILFNNSFYIILILFFSKKLLNINFPLILILYLIFPSVFHYSSYISPNFLSILFNIIFFYFLLKRMFFVYFFLSFLITLIDYQNISHFFISFSFLTYHFISKYFQLNIIQVIILLLVSLLGIILFKNQIFEIILILTPIGQSDLTYLNETYSLANQIKTLISFGLSLYYIGGSMQYLAHFFEYLVFLILLIFYIFNRLTNIKFTKIDLNNDSHLIFIFFIISCFSFVIISFLFPTISQGRYYLFILLPIIYFYLNETLLLKFIKYKYIIFIFLNINFIHSLKIYLTL